MVGCRRPGLLGRVWFSPPGEEPGNLHFNQQGLKVAHLLLSLRTLCLCMKTSGTLVPDSVPSLLQPIACPLHVWQAGIPSPTVQLGKRGSERMENRQLAQVLFHSEAPSFPSFPGVPKCGLDSGAQRVGSGRAAALTGPLCLGPCAR